MRPKITLLMLSVLVIIPAVGAEQVIATEFVLHKNDTVTNTSIDIINATVSVPGADGAYSLRLADDNGETLYETGLRVSFVERTMFGPDNELDSVSILARFPYYRNATSVELWKDGKFLKQMNILLHACTADNQCTSEQYCSYHGHNDPDCETGPSTTSLFLLIGGVLVLGAITAYGYRHHRQSNSKRAPQQERQQRREPRNKQKRRRYSQ